MEKSTEETVGRDDHPVLSEWNHVVQPQYPSALGFWPSGVNAEHTLVNRVCEDVCTKFNWGANITCDVFK